jgi:hypothetical protein
MTVVVDQELAMLGSTLKQVMRMLAVNLCLPHLRIHLGVNLDFEDVVAIINLTST